MLRCGNCGNAMKYDFVGKVYRCPHCYAFARQDSNGGLRWYDTDGKLFSPKAEKMNTVNKDNKS